MTHLKVLVTYNLPDSVQDQSTDVLVPLKSGENQNTIAPFDLMSRAADALMDRHDSVVVVSAKSLGLSTPPEPGPDIPNRV
jgi:hypothetical protein